MVVVRFNRNNYYITEDLSQEVEVCIDVLANTVGTEGLNISVQDFIGQATGNCMLATNYSGSNAEVATVDLL